MEGRSESRGARWSEFALLLGVPLAGAALAALGWIAWRALTAPAAHVYVIF